jgi:CheY-like chemotaxis protein
VDSARQQQRGDSSSKLQRSILVVDDEPPILALLQEVLEEAGYHVLTAIDGRAALFVLQQQRADLVLTDIMMPRLDGLQLTAELRADPRTTHLPVVGMSAARAPRDGIFTAFLRKPFNVEEVLDVIARLLDGRRSHS